jgi:spore coat polysaccharide biosynthesis predicted glycosyltransferase SpsG
VIQALGSLDLERVEVVVVAGASNTHREALQRSLSMYPAIRLEESVTDMAAFMAWADLAISAGGSTCWEMAFMGLPNIIMVLAENQQEIARHLESHRASVNLGWHALVNEDDVLTAFRQLITDVRRRQEMSKRGRSIIDGYGASRVVSLLKGAVV